MVCDFTTGGLLAVRGAAQAFSDVHGILCSCAILWIAIAPALTDAPIIVIAVILVGSWQGLKLE